MHAHTVGRMPAALAGSLLRLLLGLAFGYVSVPQLLELEAQGLGERRLALPHADLAALTLDARDVRVQPRDGALELLAAVLARACDVGGAILLGDVEAAAYCLHVLGHGCVAAGLRSVPWASR